MNSSDSYTHIYLDLEGTVIDNFNTWKYLEDNIKLIKAYLNKNIINASIFSYAVWCENNKNVLVQKFDEFKTIYGINIIEIVTTQDMCNIIKDPKINTPNDVWKLHKTECFKTYVENCNKYGDFILIDDTVKNELIIGKPKSIRFIGI